jgi:hypothetical protein
MLYLAKEVFQDHQNLAENSLFAQIQFHGISSGTAVTDRAASAWRRETGHPFAPIVGQVSLLQ